jgi:PAS domain S-box-containing protein
MAAGTTLTGVERFFEPDEIIVSKTDLKGCITYANQIFERISGFTEPELIGKNHNLIRHPEMPRCVFKFLWDTIQDRKEIFAYVVNRCKNGDHYWVFAHVTPSFDDAGRIIGYHSNRRVPTREALDQIMPIYAELLREESKHSNPRKQWEASLPLLVGKLEGLGITYDELMFTLCV